MFFRINEDICINCPINSRFSTRAFLYYLGGGTKGSDRSLLGFPELVGGKRCSLKYAQFSRVSLICNQRMMRRRRSWQAYLEPVKGAIILHGENMVRDGKDIALGSDKASQVYCFNCRGRA